METNLSVDKDLAQQFANRNRSPNSFIFLRESDSWFIIQSNQCLVLVNPEVEDLLARVENTKCLVRFHIFPKLQTYDYNHNNYNDINMIDLGKKITISLKNRPDWIPPKRGTRPCQDQTCWMLARPVYVWHSCQQPFHCLLAFWFFIFSSTFPFWLLYHLVNIGWFRGGRWVTEPRPQGLRLRTSSLPSRPCAKESRFVMWIFDKHSKNIHPGFSDPWTCPAPSSLSEDCCENIAKDCLLTGQELACSKITRLFVCLFVTMRKMASYTGKWLLLPPIDHIHMRNPLKTSQDQERGIISPTSLLHS